MVSQGQSQAEPRYVSCPTLTFSLPSIKMGKKMPTQALGHRGQHGLTVGKWVQDLRMFL